MRILCLHAPSQYQLMNAFLDAVGDGFRGVGTPGDDREPARDGAAGTAVRPRVLVRRRRCRCRARRAAADVAGRQSACGRPSSTTCRSKRTGCSSSRVSTSRCCTTFSGCRPRPGSAPRHRNRSAVRRTPISAIAKRAHRRAVAGSFAPKPQPQWKTGEPAAAATLKTTLQIADERWDHHVRELEVSGLFLEAAEAHGLPYVPAGHRLFGRSSRGSTGTCATAAAWPPFVRLDRAGIKTHLVGMGWSGSPTSNTQRSRVRSAIVSCTSWCAARRSWRTSARRCSTSGGTSASRSAWRTARSS